jgi:hypothetical protein
VVAGSSSSPEKSVAALTMAGRALASSSRSRKGLKQTQADTAAESSRRRLVMEVVLRLAKSNQHLSITRALALAKTLDSKSLPDLMKAALKRGADLEDILLRVQNPSNFPISVPFTGGDRAQFNPSQALIALIISMMAKEMTSSVSAAEDIERELRSLTTAQMRMRAVRANAHMGKVCDAYEAPSEGKDLSVRCRNAACLVEWAGGGAD